MKDGGKSVHGLLEQRFERFRRYVPAGKSGAAGGDDHVHTLLLRPCGDVFLDGGNIVLDDCPVDQLVAGLFEPLDQSRAGTVFFQTARVGYGKHGNPDGNEGAAFIDAAHGMFSVLHPPSSAMDVDSVHAEITGLRRCDPPAGLRGSNGHCRLLCLR